jgi:hypothetical protein
MNPPWRSSAGAEDPIPQLGGQGEEGGGSGGLEGAEGGVCAGGSAMIPAPNWDDESATGRHATNSEDCLVAGDKGTGTFRARNSTVSGVARNHDTRGSARGPLVSTTPHPLKREVDSPPPDGIPVRGSVDFRNASANFLLNSAWIMRPGHACLIMDTPGRCKAG